MTTDELITAVQQRVVNLTNATMTTSWYLDRVNDGYRALTTFYDPELKKPLRFPHFQTTRDKTIASLSTNVFPISDADIFAVTAMWDLTNSRDVPERSIRELETVDPTLTGALLKYAIVGTGTAMALRLYKIPETSISARLGVYLYPETLVVGSAEPVIPVAWHRGIEYLAAADAADKQGMPDRRDALFQMATTFIRTTRTPTQETRRRKRHMPIWRRYTHSGMR